ncbi:hypothetical protein [Amaricoccus tamworthensis]|uniref:hypothetical protein n=1 Tax=Amaricoccus tamworthensis TaxID=57002 RepID=UPI003C7E830A
MNTTKTACLAACATMLLQATATMTPAVAQENNACPVDGCTAYFTTASNNGEEVTLTVESNFLPDMSKNHFHIWWGENFTVQQVSANAETVSNVTQGDWHPTSEYPNYTTASAASTTVRNGATTLCISPADRNHDILDFNQVHCVDLAEILD